MKFFSLGDCDDLVIIMIADISVSALMGDLLSFGVVFFLQGKGGDEKRSNINIAKVVFIAGWDQWKVPDFAEELCQGASTPLNVCRMFRKSTGEPIPHLCVCFACLESARSISFLVLLLILCDFTALSCGFCFLTQCCA